MGLKNNKERAEIAITLIWIVLVLEIVSIISGYFQFELLDTAANGGEITTERAELNDLREQLVAIIYLIVFGTSAVTFIHWFRRAYFNLHLVVNDLSQSEGWAAGSWFVPIISLYRPFKIMQELYEKTKNHLAQNSVEVEKLTTKYLGTWWTLWLINSVLGRMVSRYSLKAESIDELTWATLGSMTIDLIGIPLALITIKVIKDYAHVEPILLELEKSKSLHISNNRNASQLDLSPEAG